MQNDKKIIYKSPEVELLEIAAQAIICESPILDLGTTPYEGEEW